MPKAVLNMDPSLPFEQVYIWRPHSLRPWMHHMEMVTFHLVRERKQQEDLFYFICLWHFPLSHENIKYWSLEETVLLPCLAILPLFRIVSWKRKKETTTKSKFESGDGLGCRRDGQSLGLQLGIWGRPEHIAPIESLPRKLLKTTVLFLMFS